MTTLKMHGGDKEPLPCPAHLENEARRLWEQLAPQLTDSGTLTEASAPAFEICCQAYADWRTFTAQVKAQGAIVKGPTGFPQQHPAVSLANKASETWRKHARQFGFATKAKAAPPQSSLAGFLKKRG
jgi:P27 family predicted phage terminase small subunit